MLLSVLRDFKVQIIEISSTILGQMLLSPLFDPRFPMTDYGINFNIVSLTPMEPPFILKSNPLYHSKAGIYLN